MLGQAVRVQEVQGEELVRLQVGGAAGQHVAHRVDSSELMQHELFDFTATSQGEADEAFFCCVCEPAGGLCGDPLLDGEVDGGPAPRAGEVDVGNPHRQGPAPSLETMPFCISQKPSPASLSLSHSMGQATRP